MKRAVIEQRLKFVERHVAESQKHVSRHEEIVARLERDGRKDSLTARAARGLLESLQDELAAHVADRDRLHRQLSSAS
jgi:hemerythrin